MNAVAPTRVAGTVSGSQVDAVAASIQWHCACATIALRLARRPKDRAFHVICHCRWCQGFAHVLDRVESVLDGAGGSEILGVSPATIKVVEGLEHLRCLSLSPRVLRWYADCCQTPIANTPSSRAIPHVGVLVEPMLATNDRATVDELHGPITHRIHAAHASSATPPEGAHPGMPILLLPKVAGMLSRRFQRGDHRHSPFFDRANGRPIAVPRRISREERQALPPFQSA